MKQANSMRIVFFALHFLPCAVQALEVKLEGCALADGYLSVNDPMILEARAPIFFESENFPDTLQQSTRWVVKPSELSNYTQSFKVRYFDVSMRCWFDYTITLANPIKLSQGNVTEQLPDGQESIIPVYTPDQFYVDELGNCVLRPVADQTTLPAALPSGVVLESSQTKVLRIVGISTAVALVTALAVRVYNEKYHKKLNTIKYAAIAGGCTALAATIWYYGLANID